MLAVGIGLGAMASVHVNASSNIFFDYMTLVTIPASFYCFPFVYSIFSTVSDVGTILVMFENGVERHRNTVFSIILAFPWMIFGFLLMLTCMMGFACFWVLAVAPFMMVYASIAVCGALVWLPYFVVGWLCCGPTQKMKVLPLMNPKENNIHAVTLKFFGGSMYVILAAEVAVCCMPWITPIMYDRELAWDQFQYSKFNLECEDFVNFYKNFQETFVLILPTFTFDIESPAKICVD
eukprot:UN28945